MQSLRGVLVAILLLALLLVDTYAEQQVVRYDDGAGGQMWYRVILPENDHTNRSYPLTTYL